MIFMAVFILDGGLFVGRLERQKYTNKRGYWWWKKKFNSNSVSYDDYKKGIRKSLEKDLHHFKFKMRTITEIDKVIVCYDGIYGRKMRGNYYPQYKSHKSGIKATKHKGKDIRKIIEECGFESMQIETDWEGRYDDYKEADDLIVETVKEINDGTVEIIVMSEDKDLYQILEWGDNIKIHNLRDLIESSIFEERWNIKSQQYVEWKSLVGDKSDNILGIEGFGEKKASNMLRKYGCIDNFPPHELKSFKIINPQNFSQKLFQMRSTKDYSFNYCHKNITTLWQRLETKPSNKLLPFYHGLKITEEFPELLSELEEINHKPMIDIYKKIITLPFKG